MKYYLDTEFLEGTQKKSFLGINYGNTKPTIDLISIGIVSEDNRKYYAISNEFNLKEAWNRYDLKLNENYNSTQEESHYNPMYIKVYWIRENILLSIYQEYISGDRRNVFDFSYSTMKFILKTYGKSNKQIAEEIKEFVGYPDYEYQPKTSIGRSIDKDYPEFYVYYGDYDWVVFCWLFGKMINLPNGFPYYAKDLKQIMDEKAEQWRLQKLKSGDNYTFEHCLSVMKHFKTYPKQTNEHHALNDAMFNKELHEFLNLLN